MVCLIGTVAPAAPQDEFEIDEDALFGDTATVVDSKQFLDSGTVEDEKREKSVSFSGDITASATGSVHREYFQDTEPGHTSFAGAAHGGLNLDVRLPRSVKSFVNARLAYTAPADSLRFSLNEMFVDWNFGYRAFFRAGKQVLQWGRGYFFNPVDLVNVEKTEFFDELDGREGAFGLKAHVPFQTTANLYAFVDMGNVARADSLALALKAEFLLRATEFAFSAWGKNNVDPVFGFDFSTGVLDFMITGEVALHRSLRTYSFDMTRPTPADSSKEEWIPRISLGVGRYFDLGNFNDRILINIECYYNHAGSEDKDLVPPGVDPDVVDIDALLGLIPPEVLGRILERNNVSKWYAAAFATVNRFIVTDMTLTANALVNINQRCAMLTGGLNYTTLHNLSFGLILSGFVGDDYTEYTVTGQGLWVELRTGILF